MTSRRPDDWQSGEGFILSHRLERAVEGDLDQGRAAVGKRATGQD